MYLNMSSLYWYYKSDWSNMRQLIFIDRSKENHIFTTQTVKATIGSMYCLFVCMLRLFYSLRLRRRLVDPSFDDDSNKMMRSRTKMPTASMKSVNASSTYD